MFGVDRREGEAAFGEEVVCEEGAGAAAGEVGACAGELCVEANGMVGGGGMVEAPAVDAGEGGDGAAVMGQAEGSD